MSESFVVFFVLIIFPLMVAGFIIFLHYLSKSPKNIQVPATTCQSAENTAVGNFNRLIEKISLSYKHFQNNEELIIHQFPLLENEYIQFFYKCLMLDIVKLFDSESITNSFSNNYWRAAKAKGYCCEDNIISETKLHFSSSDNLGSEEEELEQYVCAFCEKVYHMYKFKDGNFGEDIMIPMILSETFILHQNTCEKIRSTFMDISGYYLSFLTVVERNAFMQRHGIEDTAPKPPRPDINMRVNKVADSNSPPRWCFEDIANPEKFNEMMEGYKKVIEPTGSNEAIEKETDNPVSLDEHKKLIKKYIIAYSSKYIEKFEGESILLSCKDDLMKAIKLRVDNLYDIHTLKVDDTKRFALLLICDVAFGLLASGKYHIYAGELDPLGPGKSMYSVYISAMNLAVKLGYNDEESKNETIKYLNQCISEVG